MEPQPHEAKRVGVGKTSVVLRAHQSWCGSQVLGGMCEFSERTLNGK